LVGFDFSAALSKSGDDIYGTAQAIQTSTLNFVRSASKKDLASAA
jgi:hypothetical protein